ncbi:tetratricopeptide repeat protein [Marinicella sediminis]|uniref:Tetratricopeptide repeat protein n=1 Tax=Marinicella sediminis TaxID=1792834 RepID=A0ABV7J9J5_9GAMM|nr:tetratricopeptide repeat protein [Marinicella sediminis]
MKLKQSLIITTFLFHATITGAVTEVQRTAINELLQKNDWDTAMDLAEDLVDAHPQSSLAHYLLASAIRVKMQEVSQVRAMFSIGDYKESLAKAIELDPQNLDARTEEIGFYMFAPGMAGGDKAVAANKIAALKMVNQIKGLEMEAQLAAVNEDQAGAVTVLQSLIALDPHNPGALMQLAVVAMQDNDFQQADEYLLNITAEQDAGWPLMATYQRAKARVLAKQDLDTAIDLLIAYRQALPEVVSALSLPDDSAVYWRMALAHEQQGEVSEAIRLLRQSVQLNGDFEPAQEDLDRLTE